MVDKFIAEDKWNHLTGSFFVTYVFFAVFSIVPVVGVLIGLVIAPVLGFFAGLMVEIVQDANKIDAFSWRDVVANVIGCILAEIMIIYV